MNWLRAADEAMVVTGNLNSGAVKSCGCSGKYKKDNCLGNSKKEYKRNRPEHHKTYYTLYNMIRRCHDPENKAYKYIYVQ